MPTTGFTSPTHLLLLVLIGLLLFGGKRLPEIGRSLGFSVREFRQSLARPDAPSPLAADAPDPGDHQPKPGGRADGSSSSDTNSKS